MDEINTTLDVAKGVSDYGALIVIGSAFIVLSVLMWVSIFRWFKTLINRIIQQQEKMQPIIDGINQNGQILQLLAESLRPTTMLQVKGISNTCFDLAIERVCRIIKKVREENHIADHDATASKIRTLLLNLHEDRNSRFDNYHYNGKALSEYTSKEWIEWVAKVVEREVYDKKPNNGRAFTNVEAVYNRIRLDFYHRLND